MKSLEPGACWARQVAFPVILHEGTADILVEFSRTALNSPLQ